MPMTEYDCFVLLSNFETQLYAAGIEDQFTKSNLPNFNAYRSKYGSYVDKLRNHLARILLDQLHQNETSLQAGINSLNSTIQNITDEVNFLGTFGKVVGILGQLISGPAL